MPDELDGLINKVGMQFNFVQYSNKNQNQSICDIVKGCQDFFEKQTEIESAQNDMLIKQSNI